MNTPPSPSNRYRNYVLAMLTVVYVFNFIDRQLLVILQESIKADLDLSDTQLGILTGFTFAVFYVTLGIPIARVADRWNRRNVVAISLSIWSAMTAISGAVQNFFQLLLARIGVGIGEAGGSPPAHAMISDYFPVERRARALSIYSTGIYIGILFGFLVGGHLNEVFGWRMSFVMIGVPGVIFAAVLAATVRRTQTRRHGWERTIRDRHFHGGSGQGAMVTQVICAARSRDRLSCVWYIRSRQLDPVDSHSYSRHDKRAGWNGTWIDHGNRRAR